MKAEGGRMKETQQGSEGDAAVVLHPSSFILYPLE